MQLLPDQILHDRYRVVSLMGAGGMGAVYRAYDPVLNRPVAVKQLQPDPLTGQTPEQIQQQFLREAQSLAALHHPNLPRVTDYFIDGNLHYLVMDFIEGKSLQELLLETSGGLPEAQVLDWADQLLSALDYIHRNRLIHRDIKPSNIRLTPDGRIFLVDFGLVKAFDQAHPNTISLIRGVGTPEYAPPEQYDTSSGHTDERSDIFSLGATLYHLLAGRAPTSVSTRMAEPARFQPPRAINADLSPEVERVILRAMELERAKRFASAADMRQALQLARQGVEPETTMRLGAYTLPAHTALTLRTIILVGAVVSVAILLPLLIRRVDNTARPTATAAPHAMITLTQLSGLSTPEFVVIQNNGNTPGDLTGWYLESTVGPQTFNLPDGFVLAPGASVRIESYTGATHNPPVALLWSVDPIWRNAGDKAILRNKAGAAVATQCYGDACP